MAAMSGQRRFLVGIVVLALLGLLGNVIADGAWMSPGDQYQTPSAVMAALGLRGCAVTDAYCFTTVDASKESIVRALGLQRVRWSPAERNSLGEYQRFARLRHVTLSISDAPLASSGRHSFGVELRR